MSLLLSVATLAPLHAHAKAIAPPGVSLELRADALVDHARIALADVAVIHADGAQAALESELGSIVLGHAPRVGYVERLSRAQIEQAIRRATAKAGALRWSGADAVAARTATQTVDAQTLSDAAVAALEQHLAGMGGRATVSAEAAPADVLVPAGQLALRIRALPARPQHARVPVWIDLHVNGELYRSLVVQLAVTVHQQAYLARHAIDAGRFVTADDFDIAQADVAAADALPVQQSLAPFRAARPLRAGQPLTAAAMLAGGAVRRGDRFRLAVRTGSIGIDTAGIAMDDAGPGQPIRVRPSGGRDVVTGHLAPSGVVIID